MVIIRIDAAAVRRVGRQQAARHAPCLIARDVGKERRHLPAFETLGGGAPDTELVEMAGAVVAEDAIHLAETQKVPSREKRQRIVGVLYRSARGATADDITCRRRSYGVPDVVVIDPLEMLEVGVAGRIGAAVSDSRRIGTAVAEAGGGDHLLRHAVVRLVLPQRLQKKEVKGIASVRITVDLRRDPRVLEQIAEEQRPTIGPLRGCQQPLDGSRPLVLQGVGQERRNLFRRWNPAGQV